MKKVYSNLRKKQIAEFNNITQNFHDAYLEKEFRDDYFNNSLIWLRIALFTTVFLYMGFGLLDKRTSPSFSHEFFIIRFFIVVPSLIGFIITTYLKIFKKIWQPLISFALIIAGAGIIYMLHRDPLNQYYYGGLYLIFMGGYFFIKLRFFIASISGLILVIIYNITFFIIPQSLGSSIDNLVVANAFFISSNIICMIGLYGSEKYKRMDFYQQNLLNKKQEEIEQINTGLETKVNERTFELNFAKEKAEESDRLKSAFLANMSHEIRTPMNGILGFSDLLKDPQLSGDEQLRYISIIEKSGERMLETVNQIIDISKIDSGQLEINLGPVHVANEMKSLYEFFSQDTNTKGLELTFNNGITDKDCVILTDKVKFISILTNLIKNAIKFTDSGSIEISYSKNKEYFYCSISDTGIGISEDKLSSIFNRFEQADPFGRQARQGSGLGLAISKSFIELLKGAIWVTSSTENKENNVKSGSVFNFKIPLSS